MKSLIVIFHLRNSSNESFLDVFDHQPVCIMKFMIPTINDANEIIM